MVITGDYSWYDGMINDERKSKNWKSIFNKQLLMFFCNFFAVVPVIRSNNKREAEIEFQLTNIEL